MTTMDYPEWYDVMWVASDRTGALAMFFTAGYAPMPAVILNGDLSRQEALQAQVLDLPENSGAIHVHADAAGDTFSKRGFYSFDWSDIHGGWLDAYERCAVPLTPVGIVDLPESIRDLFAVAVFDVEFKDMPVLDVRAYLECVEPSRHPYQIRLPRGFENDAPTKIDHEPLPPKPGTVALIGQWLKSAIKNASR